MDEHQSTKKILSELSVPITHYELEYARKFFPEQLFDFLEKAQDYFQHGAGLVLEIRTLPGTSADLSFSGHLSRIERFDRQNRIYGGPSMFNGDTLYLSSNGSQTSLRSDQIEQISILSDPKPILLYKVNYHYNWSRG